MDEMQKTVHFIELFNLTDTYGTFWYYTILSVYGKSKKIMYFYFVQKISTLIPSTKNKIWHLSTKLPK